MLHICFIYTWQMLCAACQMLYVMLCEQLSTIWQEAQSKYKALDGNGGGTLNEIVLLGVIREIWRGLGNVTFNLMSCHFPAWNQIQLHPLEILPDTTSSNNWFDGKRHSRSEMSQVYSHVCLSILGKNLCQLDHRVSHGQKYQYLYCPIATRIPSHNKEPETIWSWMWSICMFDLESFKKKSIKKH